MSRSVHIVTGATGGIGKAIVKALLKPGLDQDKRPSGNDEGSLIILACRDEEKAGKLIGKLGGNPRLKFIRLNLMSFDNVREFAQEIAANDYQVETIFHNAGFMPSRLIVSEDGYEAATQTNFLGPALLTKLLLPRMRRGSHIVFTTSLTRHLVRLREDWDEQTIDHQSRFRTYGQSKLLLTHWGVRLSGQLQDKGILVNFSDPGAVNTGMITMGNMVVDFLADILARPLMSTPSQGARPALLAASTPLTGQLFSRRLFHTKRETLLGRKYMEPVPGLSAEFICKEL